MATTMRRWDGDQRGEGIADGTWIAEDVRHFLGVLGAENWVAEEPEMHLLPHIQRACTGAGSPWTLHGAEMRDAVYVVSLDWAGDPPRLGRLRADVFALLGAFAETATYVHQRIEDAAVCFDIATGLVDDDMPFRPHGHLVQFRVTGPATDAICASRRA